MYFTIIIHFNERKLDKISMYLYISIRFVKFSRYRWSFSLELVSELMHSIQELVERIEETPVGQEQATAGHSKAEAADFELKLPHSNPSVVVVDGTDNK